MSVEVVYETHSTSTDNEAGVASGSRDVSLSETGRRQARELGERRRGEVDAVYCSDLRRAVETAEFAFPDLPVKVDPRLRECDYGEMTGRPSKEIDAEWPGRVAMPFPGGESVSEVVARVRSFLDDLARDHDGRRVVVIGHRATWLALDHLLGGADLSESASATFVWQPGWRYVLERGARR